MGHPKDKEQWVEQDIPLQEESLKRLYHESNDPLSENDQLLLTPILNSLEDNNARYQELNAIAEGGEKKITQVYDNSLGRSVAMARPLEHAGRLEQEDFLREARLTAALDHPNIVAIYNIGKDESGIPFFTMELLPGDSLKDIIDHLRAGDSSYRTQYSLDTMLGIFQKICDAISYAHSRRVLHMDLKPENIRVGSFGEVFVCDWGLAKVMMGSPTQETVDTLDSALLNDITLSGTIQGTPGFMAPEQGQSNGTYNEAMDVYALGSILYMILTKELPVEGKSANDVLKNSQFGKIISPRHRKPHHSTSKGLSAVALKALALQPENRYTQVLDISMEIQRYLSGNSTLAEKASLSTHTILMIRRHSRGTFMLLAFMSLLMAVISFSLLRISNQRNAIDQARKRAEENLALFITEQERSRQLGTELGDVVEQVGSAMDMIHAKDMLNVLDKGLSGKLDIKEKRLLLQNKALLLFTLQEFNAAYDSFSLIQNPGKLEALQQISEEYARRKPDDKALLLEQDLADLLSVMRQDYFRFANDQSSMGQYIYYHHMRRRGPLSPEEYAPLANVMLNHLNDIRKGALTPLKLTKRHGGYHLDLSRKYYTQYRLDIMGGKKMNILKPFGQLASLDISHTPLIRISELGGARARKLRMVGLDLAHPNAIPDQLQYCYGLQQVTLDLHHYPIKTQQELQLKYEVIME